VQVKDAVEIYPILPFLAVRFGIASAVPRPRRRGSAVSGREERLALLSPSAARRGYVLQTLGLERTSVSSAGFVTACTSVLTPA